MTSQAYFDRFEQRNSAESLLGTFDLTQYRQMPADFGVLEARPNVVDVPTGYRHSQYYGQTAPALIGNQTVALYVTKATAALTWAEWANLDGKVGQYGRLIRNIAGTEEYLRGFWLRCELIAPYHGCSTALRINIIFQPYAAKYLPVV